MKFDILNRFSGEVQITAEIECNENASESYKLGLAVKWAIKAKANLRSADLRSANLSFADLRSANLRSANLSSAKNSEMAVAITRILPEGDLIGWKKCQSDVIVKLRIPADAKRSHAFGRKCRAEFADVLEVIGAEKGISKHDGSTEYVAGQRIIPDRFDENWAEECAPGIHFFITELEARAY